MVTNTCGCADAETSDADIKGTDARRRLNSRIIRRVSSRTGSNLAWSAADWRRTYYTWMLHAEGTGIGARIMRPLEGAVRMQDDAAGMAHRVGIGFGEDLDVVACVHQPVNEMAVEP